MKRIMLMMVAIAAIASCVTGCKSIEVERHAQSVATIKNADGSYTPIRDNDGKPVILDGGWEVDYNQHWNWQSFDSLHATAGTGVALDINNYAGGADATNLTGLVGTSLDGLTKLAVAVGEAYEKIAGGGAQASTALKTSKSIIEYFASKGGDINKATVTTSGNKVVVSDGTTAVQCDSEGNCTDCTVSNAAASSATATGEAAK